MNSTERFRSFHRRITSNTRSDRSGGRAAVISSSSSSCGSNARARARSSMRRNGSGTSRTCSSRSRPSRSIAASCGAHRADVGAGEAQVLGDREVGRHRRVLEHRGEPAGRASLGRRSVTGSPWMLIAPASARRTPVRILTSVDLPAPLAPSRAWTSPGRTGRSTARSATTVPNALATAVVSSSGAVMTEEIASAGRPVVSRPADRPCGSTSGHSPGPLQSKSCSGV